MSAPFNETLGKYIFKLSYLVFGIGLFTYWGNNLVSWLSINFNVSSTPTIQNIQFVGADVWLFMGVILTIFALIFKKGIALQSENDLTV